MTQMVDNFVDCLLVPRVDTDIWYLVEYADNDELSRLLLSLSKASSHATLVKKSSVYFDIKVDPDGKQLYFRAVI